VGATRPRSSNEIDIGLSSESAIIARPIVHREFDPSPINAILNHPEVFPFITLPDTECAADAAAAISDPRNVFLVVDGGCMFFEWQEPGLYEIHTNFIPGHRGKYAYHAIQEMFRWMFVRTDAMMILTRVPDSNAAAKSMARRCRFSFEFRRENIWPTTNGPVGMDYFALPYEEWAKSCGAFVQSGKFFHERLDHEFERHGRPAHDHPDEEAHDRLVGAAFEMILAGQPEKAVGLYNRWGRFAGYGPIALVSRNPAVVDIGEAVLLMDKPEFKVLKCRGPQQ
jgi:hypothetical protein